MKIADTVSFDYGGVALTGKIVRESSLPGWYIIEVAKPKGFVWRNDDTFCVLMPEASLKINEE